MNYSARRLYKSVIKPLRTRAEIYPRFFPISNTLVARHQAFSENTIVGWALSRYLWTCSLAAHLSSQLSPLMTTFRVFRSRQSLIHATAFIGIRLLPHFSLWSTSCSSEEVGRSRSEQPHKPRDYTTVAIESISIQKIDRGH